LRQKRRQAYGVTDIAYPVLGQSGHAIAALTCPYVRRIDTQAAPCAEEVYAQQRATARHLRMLKEAAA
ncbi:IclR family transcriptional regulator, partial [Burkholderia pseudomallei]